MFSILFYLIIGPVILAFLLGLVARALKDMTSDTEFLGSANSENLDAIPEVKEVADAS